MNKKIIVLILFIFLLLSTIIISIFGKNPDPPIIRVEQVTFTPNNGDVYEYVDGVFIVTIDITDLSKEDDKYIVTYQMNTVVYPSDATNQVVNYSLYNSGDKEVLHIDPTGMVTLELTEKVSYDYIILAKSTDDALNVEAKMILRIKVKQVDKPW